MINYGKKKKNSAEKKCIICNKSYEYGYDLFGRGCLNNLYDEFGISDPKYTSNKEKYLIDAIARMNSKYFLSREKKIALAKNYIALSYLNKIDLNFTKDEKNKLKENINNISPFKTLQGSSLPEYALNDFYKVYNDYIKFDEAVNQVESNENKEKNTSTDDNNLKTFSLIFNINKIKSPLFYMAYYDMQYIFWETVVVGGYLFDKPLSWYLLRLSLNNKGEYDKEHPLIIEDEYINKLLFSNSEFKKTIDDLLLKGEINKGKYTVAFSEGDLLYAIHTCDLDLNFTKKENGNFTLNIEISDTYDFTEIKKMKSLGKSKTTGFFSSTLNNFAVISSLYGVIKPFRFIIKIKIDNYRIEA